MSNVDTVRFVGTLTLGGVTTPGTPCGVCVNNTVFVFTEGQFADPTPFDLPHYNGPYSTTFSMTGHTTLAGGVDFDGVGFMTIGYIFSASGEAVLFQQFDFAPAPVPESPSLALIAFAGTVGAVAVKMKRTRARVTAA